MSTGELVWNQVNERFWRRVRERVWDRAVAQGVPEQPWDRIAVEIGSLERLSIWGEACEHIQRVRA